MTDRDETTDQNRVPMVTPRDADRAAWLSLGGILAALGAASCCVVPFALFTLGVSGPWIGNLTALEPYQAVFAAIAAACLAYGFSRDCCRPKIACAEGSSCASPHFKPPRQNRSVDGARTVELPTNRR